MRLDKLITTGVRYMQARRGETLAKIGVSADDLRSMVQGAFGELLGRQAATAAPGAV